MNEAIRLTNKTAIALRRNARKVRAAHAIAAGVLSAALAVLAFFLGLRWLFAVPLMVVAIVLMDCGIMLRARSQYLLLIGQAICTEAAAQEIRAGRSEKTRRARAINDLMGVKADVQRAQSGLERDKAPGVKPFFEPEEETEDEEDDDLLPVRKAQSKAQSKPQSRTLDMPQEAHAAPRRRRRQNSQSGSLQLIKNEAK